jgi:hypothetical protein
MEPWKNPVTGAIGWSGLQHTWLSTVGSKRIGFAWNRIQITHLPHFYSSTNTNSNVLEYEYKTDVSNSETHSDITCFGRQQLPIFFIRTLQLQSHVKTKLLGYLVSCHYYFP